MKTLYSYLSLILFFICLASISEVDAQASRTFNYQGVILDNDGAPIANESITISVSIAEAGLAYTTTAVTSSLGAFSVPIEIGQEITFDQMINYNIESTITSSQGVVTATSPLSVAPIAIYADKAGGIIGIEELDESPSNELQTLSIDGTSLSISNGNTINLPTGGGGTGDGDNDSNNEIQEITVEKIGEEIMLSLNPGNSITFDIADSDNSVSNEIQVLSIENGNLILSNGGGQISLTTLGDGTEDADSDPENEIQSWEEIPGIPEGLLDGIDDVDDADSDPENEIQQLQLDLNTLSITGSNSVDLSAIAINVEDEDADPENEIQTLILDGNSLSISDGSTVNLSATGAGSPWQTSGATELYYNSGNVGIGTNDPNSQLSVSGSSNLDGIKIEYTDGEYQIISPIGFSLNLNGHKIGRFNDAEFSNGVVVGDTDNPTPGSIRYSDNQHQIYGDYCADPNFDGSSFLCWTNVVDLSPSEWYNFSGNTLLSGSGNVGIGASNPTSKLHVFGDIRATDDLIVNDELQINQNGINILRAGDSASGAAFLNTYNASGSQLVSLTTASSSGLGYVAVRDGGGSIKTGIYVNSSNQGVVFGDVKNFVSDYPGKPDKVIVYASLEGPEAAAYTRGTASLSEGVGQVDFSDHFKHIVDIESMTVIITPLSSDSKGIAVIQKTDLGFSVKELFDGNGTYEFDWEVKCIRKGYENYRAVRDRSELEATSTDK